MPTSSHCRIYKLQLQQACCCAYIVVHAQCVVFVRCRLALHPLFLHVCTLQQTFPDVLGSPGILESLGGLASRLTSLLQPQQQLTPQQLEDLTDIAEAVLNVIGTLGTAWPQNIFKAKAFEQCLQPWVDLAAALPAALKAADADSAADDDAPRSRISDITGRSILPGLSLTGTAFAHNITKAPGADKGIITPTSQAMRRLCSSDSLHKVLAWNFALATLMKHRQARGTFQVTAFFEGAERSSSRVKQLQIPAHHQQLLSELGVTTDSPPSMLQHVYGSR